MNEHIGYLESVIDNIVDIITILDADGKIRYESASIRGLGYEPEELVGRSVFELVHPDDKGRVLKVFFSGVLKPGHADKVEVRFRHKEGEWRLLECSAKNLLFDPRVRGIVVSSRDISKRRDLEERFRLNAEALQAVGNGVVITNPDGMILWINKAFTDMTGYELGEVRGKNPRILKSGEQDPQLYRDLWLMIKTGRVWRGELINRRKDGSQYFESMVITPILHAGGKISHFVAVKEDITERKALENQFRQAQKMEAVGRLSGGLAHDFNNILTVIMGRADFLARKIQGEDAAMKDVEEIKLAAQRAAALTRQLLAFSRKQMLQPKVIRLNQVVSDAASLVRQLIGEDIELVLKLSAAKTSIKIDPGQLEQVLMNLAVNARDAMPRGGRLCLETQRRIVQSPDPKKEPGLVSGEYVVLSVSDTGCGMSPEVCQHIFEPFFTTKEKGKGTGLGLSTVYGVMKQSLGYIYVESALNQGTTFNLFLPAVAEAVSEAPVPVPAREPPGGTEVILVVEDEEIVRNVAVRALRRSGYQVLEAGDGIEALKILKSYEGPAFAAIFTDVVMPHMGGGELAEHLVRDMPKTAILFTSGYTDQVMFQKWRDKGYHFLRKPYMPSELLFALREVLDARPAAA